MLKENDSEIDFEEEPDSFAFKSQTKKKHQGDDNYLCRNC
jgi:hypothetical protein